MVFDSGMGGLTVVSELKSQGFSGKISYAADTGFFPYGDKTDTELTARIPELAARLIAIAQPDIFVIACNTASTLALDGVRARTDIPVVGTVPAIKPAAKLTRTGTIGVLATPGTLRRSYPDALVHEFARDSLVLSHGSVKLVELAERSAIGENVSGEELKSELELLFRQVGGDVIDVVVLACTHFPLLKDRLSAIAGEGVSFIDSGAAIARRVMTLLGEVRADGDAMLDRVYMTGASASADRLILATERLGFAGQTTIEV